MGISLPPLLNAGFKNHNAEYENAKLRRSLANVHQHKQTPKLRQSLFDNRLFVFDHPGVHLVAFDTFGKCAMETGPRRRFRRKDPLPDPACRAS
jgi:hypothetical protein